MVCQRLRARMNGGAATSKKLLGNFGPICIAIRAPSMAQMRLNKQEAQHSKYCHCQDYHWAAGIRHLHSHRKVIHIILSQNTLCKRLFIHIRELLAQPNTICMCKRANFNMYRVVFLIRNFCLWISNLHCYYWECVKGIKLWPKRGFQGTFWPENKEPPL